MFVGAVFFFGIAVLLGVRVYRAIRTGEIEVENRHSEENE